MKKTPVSDTAATSTTHRGGRIRLAFAITDLDVGGAERALVELATRLDPTAFDVRVWGLMPPAVDPARSLVPLLRNAGIPVETLDARGLGDALRVVRQLTAAWRAWQPDLVQTFLFHANILGRFAAWRARVRHVVSGLRVAERRGRWRLRVDRWTDRLVERHVCVSQAVADFSRREGGLSANKLLVIPNGIDASRYTDVRPIEASEIGLPAGRRWVACVGRLDSQKGLDWLIEHAPSWLLAHPQHDLILVGEGHARLTIESLIRERAIGNRVHLAGWQANVPGILAASDLLVLPARWEGMPNVVLEAMASSRPVLAADVEGIRELLGNDAGPQIAAPGDVAQWRANLDSILGDRMLAAALGRRNRRRAEEHFTLEAVTAAYTQLYLGLLSTPATDRTK